MLVRVYAGHLLAFSWLRLLCDLLTGLFGLICFEAYALTVEDIVLTLDTKDHSVLTWPVLTLIDEDDAGFGNWVLSRWLIGVAV